MVYSNRESTKKAIRTALDREVKECNLLKQTKILVSTPLLTGMNFLKNEKAGISAKNFRNANGVELIYKD